jgi:S-formylglutathione hydrolase
MKTVSENACFGGTQGVYRHTSKSCACDMTFGLFLPQEAKDGPVPILWYLSGLTCTHENAMVKAGAQVWAAEHGIALIFPDTSPRGETVADDESYDLGQGAGFYVDALKSRGTLISRCGAISPKNSQHLLLKISASIWIVNPSLATRWVGMVH